MDQLKYYCEHPPRCLSAFQAMVADIADIVVGCHGELMNTLFRLKCQCGATHHSILGHYWRNPDFNNVLVFLSPLALRCEACRREA